MWRSLGGHAAGRSNVTAIRRSQICVSLPPLKTGIGFAIEEERGKHHVVLRGQSPVYWARWMRSRMPSSNVLRQKMAAGQTWETDDHDNETGQAIRQPGEYRTFRAWDAAEGYSPEPSPAPEWRTRDEVAREAFERMMNDRSSILHVVDMNRSSMINRSC